MVEADSRAWYSRINAQLCDQGFWRSNNDATLYVNTLFNDGSLILSLYIDDVLVIGRDEQELQKFKGKMKK